MTHGWQISSSHRPALPRKKGLAKFFTSLCDLCRSSYDISHKSLELSQDTRRKYNAFTVERGHHDPTVGDELPPVPYINYVIPALDEDMFRGFDPS